MNLGKKIRELYKYPHKATVYFKCGDVFYMLEIYERTRYKFFVYKNKGSNPEKWRFEKVKIRRFGERNYPNTPGDYEFSVIVSRYLKLKHKNNIEIIKNLPDFSCN